MLTSASLKVFLPTVKPHEAKHFYQDVLGFPLLSEDEFALEFDSNGTSLRITIVQGFQPYPFTALGWTVDDLERTIDSLSEKGVSFEQFSFLKQDNRGIWKALSGVRIAWLKDPDGNVLSLNT